MADTHLDSGRADAGIDLTQFYQVFFEEAGENLDRLEQLLLEIDIASADDEVLNSIFRCAHSVKGGAATFGFADVAQLTHQMETLLDKLRRHELQPTSGMVDVLLQAGDALRAQLLRHQGGDAGEVCDIEALQAALRSLASGQTPVAPVQRAAPSVAAPAAAAPASASAPAPGEARALELRVGPLDQPAQADSLGDLFKEIADLGTFEPIDGGRDADGLRRFKVVTTSSDSDLLELFSFHFSPDKLVLLPLGPGYGFHAGAPGAPTATEAEAEFGFFDGAPGAPSSGAATEFPATATAAPQRAAAAAKPSAAAADASTLRVSVEKVDQLINLVGELVITQAMLAQTTRKLEPAVMQQMAAGLADLERNTRDLQESVMSIRMIPMSVVFNRFPRMLRDLAAKLEKKVEFVTQGDSTELDKGLVEKITDPLTHLVRNSCDHGIELPAERLARGKGETGTITLAASHQGGSILIEVRDDGKGLSREKLLKKAREKGIDAPDSMTDAEVWSLIFAPGFSTAEVVTDVSGRGVGMDVVKRNITSLGGTVEIESCEGMGMSVKVRLPLTLAIMDSMSVAVAGETYILSLSSVVESFSQSEQQMLTVGGANGQVVRVRDEYLPVVDLEQVFAVPRHGTPAPSSILVVVESGGVRMALRVDELLGQQQVVVKNLEANYRKVDFVSGATILGDGNVALILDVDGLVRRSRH